MLLLFFSSVSFWFSECDLIFRGWISLNTRFFKYAYRARGLFVNSGNAGRFGRYAERREICDTRFSLITATCIFGRTLVRSGLGIGCRCAAQVLFRKGISCPMLFCLLTRVHIFSHCCVLQHMRRARELSKLHTLDNDKILRCQRVYCVKFDYCVPCNRQNILCCEQ